LKQYTSSAFGSKGYIPVDAMGSSHNMMAIVHMDGTVANAWPLSPLQVEKQPVASLLSGQWAPHLLVPCQLQGHNWQIRILEALV
jgi:hypothetical protein